MSDGHAAPAEPQHAPLDWSSAHSSLTLYIEPYLSGYGVAPDDPRRYRTRRTPVWPERAPECDDGA